MEAIRPARRPRWTAWCAVLVLAVLAMSLLHAASPHLTAQRHCATCLALSSPALAHAAGVLALPDPPSQPLASESVRHPLCKNVRLHRPLRAPPGTSIV
jgi:hypothetical protein